MLSTPDADLVGVVITVGGASPGGTIGGKLLFLDGETWRGVALAAGGAGGKTWAMLSIGVLVACIVPELPDEEPDPFELIDEEEPVLGPILGLFAAAAFIAALAIPLLDIGGPLSPAAGGLVLFMGTLATMVPKLEAEIEFAKGDPTAGGLVLACLALTAGATPTSVDERLLPMTELARLPLGEPYPLGDTLPIGLLVPLILEELRDLSDIPEAEELVRVDDLPRLSEVAGAIHWLSGCGER